MGPLAWHTFSPEDVAHAFDSDPIHGIVSGSVSERLDQHGLNVFTQRVQFRPLRIIVRQLVSPLSFVLVLAGIAAFFLSDTLDAIVIAAAVGINVMLGTYQEGRAARVFDELTAASKETTTVIRDGKQIVLSSESIVPGDLLILSAGKRIPADARLCEASNLSINESILTGEWLPVEKTTAKEEESADPRRASNMVWSGTLTAHGVGRAIVVATGANSSFGQLAANVSGVDETKTPLIADVERLARTIMWLVGVITIGIILLGVARGSDIFSIALVAIAVAVAAMPEGLPTALTIVLSVGMEAIMRKGGLVKSLIAAETLGSTTVILTDKTGTLTEGNMSLRRTYSARGMRLREDELSFPDNRAVLVGAVHATDAFEGEYGDDGTPVIHGRPVERAVVAAGQRVGGRLRELSERLPRIDIVPFESRRRYAISLNRDMRGETHAFVTGAPETLLALSSHYALHDGVHVLDAETRHAFEEAQRLGSAEGHRFTAVATKTYRDRIDHVPGALAEGKEHDLTFLGLIEYADSVRADVPGEIVRAREAGIKVLMVTGDFPETALAVAREAGIATNNSVLSGDDMQEMSDEELLHALKESCVVARVTPEEKLRIVSVLRQSGEVVAMTGDGINDAPALVAADIGVAVGSGTDVAKAAADIILTDNSFSVITAAIAEGRRAIANVRKTIVYLLSTSVGEVWIIGGALVSGLPLPLVPTQLLWTNIIHEGFMSVPYAFEPGDTYSMKEVPRGLHEHALTQKHYVLISVASVLGGATLFGFFMILLHLQLPLDMVRTLMFGALSLTALSFALSLKDAARPLWRIDIFNNRALIVGLGINILLLVVSMGTPLLRELLSLKPIGADHVLLLTLFALVNIFIIESAKWSAHRLARA